MRSTTDALKRAGWLLVLPLLAWLALWIPDLHSLVQTVILAVFVFVAGAVGAIALPDHRLRNGTIAGSVAFLVGVALAVLVGWLLGHTPGPGETYGSVLAELPVWLLITLPIAAVVAFLGAGLMVLWRRHGLTGGPTDRPETRCCASSRHCGATGTGMLDLAGRPGAGNRQLIVEVMPWLASGDR